ncbi:cupredoxin superfamily protein [Tasmannia lanceolata]|uniref:cupredoxin superfamily protein n=1 Tax=Tasmannia lanceolata TaxID=3420 RepID=UPI0040643BC0
MALIGSRVPLVLMVAIFILPAFALTTEFIVGGEDGWTAGVDYAAWANGKKFFVGDVLVFNYAKGAHTVVKVNGTGFSACQTSPNSGVFTSGNDKITLLTPGNKWYICGVSNHCSYYNQKLKITVMPKMMMWAPAPAPEAGMEPEPAPTGSPCSY